MMAFKEKAGDHYSYFNSLIHCILWMSVLNCQSIKDIFPKKQNCQTHTSYQMKSRRIIKIILIHHRPNLKSILVKIISQVQMCELLSLKPATVALNSCCVYLLIGTRNIPLKLDQNSPIDCFEFVRNLCS